MTDQEKRQSRGELLVNLEEAQKNLAHPKKRQSSLAMRWKGLQRSCGATPIVSHLRRNARRGWIARIALALSANLFRVTPRR